MRSGQWQTRQSQRQCSIVWPPARNRWHWTYLATRNGAIPSAHSFSCFLAVQLLFVCGVPRTTPPVRECCVSNPWRLIRKVQFPYQSALPMDRRCRANTKGDSGSCSHGSRRARSSFPRIGWVLGVPLLIRRTCREAVLKSTCSPNAGPPVRTLVGRACRRPGPS